MGDLTSYELASHLTSITGAKWEVSNVSRLNDDYVEANCYTLPGLLSVIVRREKDSGNVILWRYGLSISHPEGRISEHKDEPYIYITSGGTADTIEAAAKAAMTCKLQPRELAGRMWWPDSTVYGGAATGWVTPIQGQEVTLTPISDGGWSYRRPMPELQAIAGMISSGGGGTATGALSGEAASLEEAAALALTAPERLRLAMRGFLALDGGGSDYEEGVKDGRAALFAEIAAIYRPSSDPWVTAQVEAAPEAHVAELEHGPGRIEIDAEHS